MRLLNRCTFEFQLTFHIELCFWLFLTSVGSSRSRWFSSIQFKVWGVGSICSVVGLPLTTWFKRSDPLEVGGDLFRLKEVLTTLNQCEAWTFLVGSSGSLLITIISLRVVYVYNIISSVSTLTVLPYFIIFSQAIPRLVAQVVR